MTAGLTFKSGDFQLDEMARMLTVRGREIVLQPKVFDLLVYLVRHRSRVISKDELLDAIWPDVTVTDNSLQRAVSALRSLLREEGMDDAVRNFPRSGYRFCLDGCDNVSHAGEPQLPQPKQSASPAHEAIAQQRWRDAAGLFETMDAAQKLEGEDLDQWALAVQCLGDPSKAINLLTRATAAHAEANKPERAAVSAALLATMHLERGDNAIAQGWIARAQDLVVNPEAAAAGYVMWAASRIAAFTGNIEHAFDLADRAYDLGRTLGDRGIEALGLMYRGFYRLCLGNTRDGVTDQNHAGALALSCKLDPLTSAALYCNILWACRSLGDWARANQWSAGYQQLCADAGMDFSGSCQLHHAEVLAVQGTLAEALNHIGDALARLPGDAPWSLGDAHRVLGDIHAAVGNSKDAFEAYDKSYALGWSPEPGRAMLLAEQGEFDAAYAALERSLEGESWRSVQQQGVLLAHLALVAALAGRRNKAFALIEQISAQSERWSTASINAITSEALGILANKQGDTREALQHFHRARQLWAEIGSRLNATRIHLRIAEAQLALGDKTGAAAEARIALQTATELKSPKMIKQSRQIQSLCLNALPMAS